MKVALDLFFLIIGGLYFKDLYNRHIDWKYKDERGYLINVWIFFINYPIMFYLMDRMLFFVAKENKIDGGQLLSAPCSIAMIFALKKDMT